MKNIKTFMGRMAFVVALAVFIYSAYSLISLQLIYREADREHEEIVAIAGSEQQDDEMRQIDFDALSEINEDIIGWIYVEGTGIDHPIVQGEDNEFYLTTTFSGTTNPSGAIFMDMHNAPDFSDSQTMIYGHNMKNGAMFSALTKFQEQSFFDEFSTFTIFTPDGEVLQYEIFSAYVVSAYSDTYAMAFMTGEIFGFYLDYITGLSEIETGITPSSTDKIVSLSTCEYQFDDARMIVHGRLMEGN